MTNLQHSTSSRELFPTSPATTTLTLPAADWIVTSERTTTIIPLDDFIQASFNAEVQEELRRIPSLQILNQNNNVANGVDTNNFATNGNLQLGEDGFLTESSLVKDTDSLNAMTATSSSLLSCNLHHELMDDLLNADGSREKTGRNISLQLPQTRPPEVDAGACLTNDFTPAFTSAFSDEVFESTNGHNSALWDKTRSF